MNAERTPCGNTIADDAGMSSFKILWKIVGKQNCEHEVDVGSIRTAIWKFYYHRVIRHKSAGIDPAQPIEPLPRWFPLIAAVKLQMPPHLVETTRWSPLTPQRSKCPHMSSATPSLHKKTLFAVSQLSTLLERDVLAIIFFLLKPHSYLFHPWRWTIGQSWYQVNKATGNNIITG